MLNTDCDKILEAYKSICDYTKREVEVIVEFVEISANDKSISYEKFVSLRNTADERLKELTQLQDNVDLIWKEWIKKALDNIDKDIQLIKVNNE